MLTVITRRECWDSGINIVVQIFKIFINFIKFHFKISTTMSSGISFTLNNGVKVPGEYGTSYHSYEPH